MFGGYYREGHVEIDEKHLEGQEGGNSDGVDAGAGLDICILLNGEFVMGGI